MGFLDRLLGRAPQQAREGYAGEPADVVPGASPGRTPGAPQDSHGLGAPYDQPASEDERAIARYRYLLRTAPPERLEQVHAEAFERLTPDQRQQVLASLSEALPPEERPASTEPAALARAATRAEAMRPGTLQQTFARPGGGLGMGSVIGGSMLGTIAGVVVGSALADMMLGGFDSSPEAAEVGEGSVTEGTSGDGGGDSAEGGGTDGDAGDSADSGGSSDSGFGGGDFDAGFGDGGGFDGGF